MDNRLKVLFVSSGTKLGSPSPIIQAQGTAVADSLASFRFFIVKKGGFGGYFSEGLRLRRFLKGKDVNIIHAHYGLSGFVGLVGRRKQKLVVSFMGTDLLGAENINGIMTMPSMVLSRINIFLARHFYDHCIVKSAQMESRLNVSNMSLIPNGVDIDTFKPGSKEEARRSLGLNPEDTIVIFVSDPDRAEKNYKLAEQSVELTGLPRIKLITVCGIPHNQLAAYYNACDVMLLTSFHEGSPNVIKEAMACNCPIVSTDVGDVKWVIGNVEGCFLSTFDPSEFAGKLKLAVEFAMKNRFTKGRDRIIRLGLDSVTVASRIIEIYKHQLKQ